MIEIIIQKIQDGDRIKDSLFNITEDGKVLTLLVKSPLTNQEIENVFKNISIDGWKFNNIKDGEMAMNVTESIVIMGREIQFKK